MDLIGTGILIGVGLMLAPFILRVVAAISIVTIGTITILFGAGK